MSEQLYAGDTSQSIDVFLQDSSSSTGAGLTGLVYNSAGLTCYYRKGATGTSTAITLATQTVGGAYSSGGFVEVDSTNMPGIYRLDVPNAVIDTSGYSTIYLQGATNLLPTAFRIDCRAVRADAVAVSGDTTAANNIEADYDGTGYNKSNSTIGTCTVNTDMRGTDSAYTGTPPTAVEIRTEIDSNSTQLASILTDTGTTLPATLAVIDSNVDAILVDTGTTLPGLITTIDTNVDAILVDTGTTIPGQISGLNDISATDIVSAGPITTLSGAVVNVDTVDVVTTNSDMRGTDSAFLASSAPANFGDLAITATTGKVTVGTNDDKSGYLISGTITTLDGLNNFDPATDTVANVTLVDTTTTNSDMRGTDSAYTGTPPTAAAIADAVCDEALSGHNTAGTLGKILKQISEGWVQVEAAVNDASATTTSFVTDLTETRDNFYSDCVLVFIDGNIAGQSRPVTSYNGTTKTVTFDEALTTAPDNSSNFLILTGHTHPVSEIQNGLATSANQTTILNRLGAFTGTGVNTVLGFFKSLLSKTASTPSDVGGTFDASTDSTEAIRDNQSAGGGGGGGLTQDNIDSIVAGVQSVADNVQDAQAGILTGYQYSTWTQQITDLAPLTGYDDIVFVLKRNGRDPDSESILKISNSVGLEVLNGSTSVTAGDASITVDQESPGEITIVVASTVMASVPVGKWYDGLKKLDVGADTVLRQGHTIIRESAVDETS